MQLAAARVPCFLLHLCSFSWPAQSIEQLNLSLTHCKMSLTCCKRKSPTRPLTSSLEKAALVGTSGPPHPCTTTPAPPPFQGSLYRSGCDMETGCASFGVALPKPKQAPQLLPVFSTTRPWRDRRMRNGRRESKENVMPNPEPYCCRCCSWYEYCTRMNTGSSCGGSSSFCLFDMQ